ncbi:MAG: ExbD/TolR family protein, partial [Thermoanaerobaculia bacterium]
DVQLPVTDNPDKKPENSSQKLISVRWATPPQLYLETRPLSKQDFQRELDELYQRAPSSELIIKADQRLKYGEVKEVMKMSKDAGFQNVGLITDKKVVAPAVK